MSWDIAPLSSVLDRIDAGKSPMCMSRPAAAGEWGILKVSAIHTDGFKPEENKAVANPLHINESYVVKDGDLLISRSNTYELVGLTCIVHNPPPQLMLCDKTLRLNVSKDLALPEFILHVLQNHHTRSYIEVNATGTSGTMKNISHATIESLLIQVPPLEEQETICRCLNASSNYIRIEKGKRDKLIQLKRGLMRDLLTGRVRVNEQKLEAVAG
jgi:type I restriction enzyme S subunit